MRYLLIIIMALLMAYNAESPDERSDRAFESYLIAHRTLANIEGNTYFVANRIAQDPRLADALTNRAALVELMDMFLFTYEAATGVDAFMVTDAEGTVLIRTHNRDFYGDTANTVDIFQALSGNYGWVSSYRLLPTMPLAFSVVAPIVTNGEVVGTITVFANLAQDALVDFLSDVSNAHISLYGGPISENRIVATTLRNPNGQRKTGALADPVVITTVMESTFRFVLELNHHGTPLIAYYIPLMDANGRPVGMMAVMVG